MEGIEAQLGTDSACDVLVGVASSSLLQRPMAIGGCYSGYLCIINIRRYRAALAYAVPKHFAGLEGQGMGRAVRVEIGAFVLVCVVWKE